MDWESHPCPRMHRLHCCCRRPDSPDSQTSSRCSRWCPMQQQHHQRCRRPRCYCCGCRSESRHCCRPSRCHCCCCCRPRRCCSRPVQCSRCPKCCRPRRWCHPRQCSSGPGWSRSCPVLLSCPSPRLDRYRSYSRGCSSCCLGNVGCCET